MPKILLRLALALALLTLALPSCTPTPPAPDAGQCPPDGGCYCSSPSDDAACLQYGPKWAPYCCTGRGGALVECGQPVGCAPKPGILDAGAQGANYCCPR